MHLLLLYIETGKTSIFFACLHMLLTKCRDLIEFVAVLFCAAGCGSTAAEGESAVLADTALAEEKSTGTVTGRS